MLRLERGVICSQEQKELLFLEIPFFPRCSRVVRSRVVCGDVVCVVTWCVVKWCSSVVCSRMYVLENKELPLDPLSSTPFRA